MREAAGSAAAPAARCRKFRRGRFISKPPSATLFIPSLRRRAAPAIRRTVVLKWSRLVRDPAVVVGLDDPTEPIRRNRHQLAADSLETLLEVGHRLRDRLLEASDRGRWRTGRSE